MKTKIDISDRVVIVGPHEYKILLPYFFKERSDYNGQADHEIREIRVGIQDCCGNKRPEMSTLVTFIHEVIHCVDQVYCNSELFSNEDRERCVNLLANGLVQALGMEW